MSIRIIGASQSSEVNVAFPTSTSSSLYITPYTIDDNLISTNNTFDAVPAAFTPGATPQDVVTIMSTGTKIISVTRFRFSTTQTTAGVNSWYLVRRMTPNYAGTFTYTTPVARNITGINIPSTAVVQSYTANPTQTGVSMGFIRSSKVYSSVTTITTGSCEQSVYDFDDFQSNPIVLRGYGQVLSLNFNGAALPAGLSVTAALSWTEK